MSCSETDVADEHQASLFDVSFYQLPVSISKKETVHRIQAADVLQLLRKKSMK